MSIRTTPRLPKVALLALIAVLASACQIRIDTNIRINDDGSGTFAMEIGFDEEFRELAQAQGGDLTSSATPAPPGWEVEEFSSDGFEGTRIAANFTDPVDLQAKLKQLEQAGEGETPESLTDGIQIRQNGDAFFFETQISQVENDFAQFDLGEEALVAQVFQVRFVVTMPGTIGDHNATTQDGNTLIWNIPVTGGDQTLFATSTLGGGLPVGLPVIAAGALAVGLAGGFLAYRRKTKTSPVPSSLVSAAIPQAPAGPVEGDPFA
jgi:hypothetical protein